MISHNFILVAILASALSTRAKQRRVDQGHAERQRHVGPEERSKDDRTDDDQHAVVRQTNA